MVCNQRRCPHLSYIPSIHSPSHVLYVTINVGITLYKKTHNSLSWIILRLDATAKHLLHTSSPLVSEINSFPNIGTFTCSSFHVTPIFSLV